MKVGEKIKVTYKNQNGIKSEEVMLLSDKEWDIVSEDDLSNEEVYALLREDLQKFELDALVKNGYILAARNLLKKKEDATEIYPAVVTASQPNGGGGGDAGAAILILAIIAFIIAVIFFPLLVILGMHNKLFLKNFYNKYEGEKFADFVKKYTFVGIGLYALVAILVAVDLIFKLNALISPAFMILLFGGIAYFVVSLFFIKKNFAAEGEKINVIETIKSAFKKSK